MINSKISRDVAYRIGRLLREFEGKVLRKRGKLGKNINIRLTDF